MNLADRYSKTLSNLKPLLPKGYQEEISVKSGIESIYIVKNAFAGRLKDTGKLIKILTVAREMARENVGILEAAKAETTKLKRAARI